MPLVWLLKLPLALSLDVTCCSSESRAGWAGNSLMCNGNKRTRFPSGAILKMKANVEKVDSGWVRIVANVLHADASCLQDTELMSCELERLDLKQANGERCWSAIIKLRVK